MSTKERWEGKGEIGREINSQGGVEEVEGRGGLLRVTDIREAGKERGRRDEQVGEGTEDGVRDWDVGSRGWDVGEGPEDGCWGGSRRREVEGDPEDGCWRRSRRREVGEDPEDDLDGIQGDCMGGRAGIRTVDRRAPEPGI